jgi:hypothetical protein
MVWTLYLNKSGSLLCTCSLFQELHALNDLEMAQHGAQFFWLPDAKDSKQQHIVGRHRFMIHYLVTCTAYTHYDASLRVGLEAVEQH